MLPIVLAACLLAQAAAPHTTHYPRHGGVFFPAAGDTLHIEGAWPAQRVFKLHVYDQASRPLPLERLRTITGSVTAAGATAPLVLRDEDGWFEARIPSLPLPGELTVQLRFVPDGEPEGFHFIFPGYTDERALTFALEPTVLQDSAAGLLTAMQDDVREVAALIERHQSAYAFAPAVRLRDRLLALEKFLPPAGHAMHRRADAALRDAVRVSWLLHVAADEGAPPQLAAALEEMRAALAEVTVVIAGGAP